MSTFASVLGLSLFFFFYVVPGVLLIVAAFKERHGSTPVRSGFEGEANAKR